MGGTKQVKKSHREALIEVLSDIRDAFHRLEQDSLEFMIGWNNNCCMEYDKDIYEDFQKEYQDSINDIFAKIKLLLVNSVCGDIYPQTLFALYILQWWHSFVIENQNTINPAIIYSLIYYRNLEHFIEILDSALDELKRIDEKERENAKI